MEGKISFRPITDKDEELLFRLYACSREMEMAVANWPESQKDAFLRSQFAIQRDYYRRVFTDADFEVVLLDGKEIGRHYVYYGQVDILVMDLVLFPEYRGHGVGTGLMTAILDKANEQGLPVHAYVEYWSRALNLFNRLGFSKIGENGVYRYMEWLPSTR